jgi:hypothetical protein
MIASTCQSLAASSQYGESTVHNNGARSSNWPTPRHLHRNSPHPSPLLLLLVLMGSRAQSAPPPWFNCCGLWDCTKGKFCLCKHLQDLRYTILYVLTGNATRPTPCLLCPLQSSAASARIPGASTVPVSLKTTPTFIIRHVTPLDALVFDLAFR